MAESHPLLSDRASWFWLFCFFSFSVLSGLSCGRIFSNVDVFSSLTVVSSMVLIRGSKQAWDSISCESWGSVWLVLVEIDTEDVGEAFGSLGLVEGLKIDSLALSYRDSDPVLAMEVSRAP